MMADVAAASPPKARMMIHPGLFVWLISLGIVASVSACKVERGGPACAAPGTNSAPYAGGGCACDEGFSWCQPDDPTDHSCCALEPCAGGNDNHTVDGECVCNVGFVWCPVDGEANQECCAYGSPTTGDTATTDSTGDTGTT